MKAAVSLSERYAVTNVAAETLAPTCCPCGQDTDGGSLCDTCSLVRFGCRPAGSLRVRYFDAALSRAGKGGVRVKSDFETLDQAERFAAANKLYAKPCKVEEVRP